MNATLAWADWKGDAELRRDACTVRNPGVGTQEVKPPTDEEWGRALQVIYKLPDPARSILTILTTSGLRFGDVMHISRTSATLALSNREITIYQKGDKLRKWAPGTDTRAAFAALIALPDWEKVRDLIDPLPDTPPVTEAKRDAAAYHQIRRLLHHVCRMANVAYIRPHRFRHAISEAARKRGMSPEDRKKLLGHRDYRTTIEYYTHTSADSQIAVVDDIVSSVLKVGKTR